MLKQLWASNGKLWLIFAICLAPIVASYLTYYFWRPTHFKTYGDLLEIKPLIDPPLKQLDNSPYRLSQLKGKWLLLTSDRAMCDTYCEWKLFLIRQLRLAQGKNMSRVERVWLIEDTASPAPTILNRYPDMWVLFANNSALLQQLPHQAPLRNYIYLIDPLGNQVMRYSGNADPKLMIKELNKLLKNNQRLG